MKKSLIFFLIVTVFFLFWAYLKNEGAIKQVPREIKKEVKKQEAPKVYPCLNGEKCS